MKRLIAVLSLVCIMVSTFVPASFAADGANTRANGIASMFLFQPGADLRENVTRAEFAEILCVLTDADSGMYVQVPLADMEISDELYPYVARAINLGYFAAPESGLFRPDDGVYAYQVVSTFIDILGYRPIVQSTDYTNDWAYGARLGLMNGLTVSQMDFLSKEQMAVICRNVLDVDVMEQECFGETETYKAKEGRNLLVKYYNAQYVEGVVTANGRTALMSQTEIDKNEIRIGNVTLNCGATNATTLLGYEVECWYADNNIIYIEKTAQNQSLNISSANICTSGRQEIVYTEGDKEKKARISPEADLVYNNSAVYGFDEKLLKPATGYVNLLDNNGDGRYDIVFVHEFVNYFVTNVNTTDMRVVDGIRNITVDFDADNKTSVEVYSYDHSSKSLFPVEVPSLYRKNIVSAEVSLDGQNITLIRSDVSLTGTVQAISTDASEPEITVDDTTYKLSGDLVALMNDGRLPEIKPGSTGTFYVDYTGSIAYADFTNNGYRYGYMSKAKMQSGIDGKLMVRVFTDEDTWQTFTVENKIKINGKPLDVSLAVQQLASAQIIRYKQNSKGILTDICLATDKTGETGYPGYTTDDFTVDFSGKTQKYKSKDFSFSKKYSFELGTTSIFVIPASAVDANGNVDEDAIFLADSTYFINDRNYDITVYDSDEYFIPNVIVISKTSEEAYQSRLFYLNKVSEALDEHGDEVYFITGYLNGTLCKYMYSNAEVASKLRPGDALKIALRGNGEIRLITPVASIDPENTSGYTPHSINTPGTYNYNSAVGTYVGTAFNVDYKRNTVIAFTTSSNTLYKFVGNGNVFWIFDTKEKEFIPASISDFEGTLTSGTPSRIFVMDRFLETKDIVVVK